MKVLAAASTSVHSMKTEDTNKLIQQQENAGFHAHAKINGCVHEFLPKEMMLKIFSYLDYSMLSACSLVCKTWYHMANDSCLWRIVSLKRYRKKVNNTVVRRIASRAGDHLRFLSLYNCRDVGDDAMRSLKCCPNLGGLVLNQCVLISDCGLLYLASGCHQLEVLDIGFCPLVSDIGIGALCSGCTGLRFINISWCRQITHIGIKFIAAVMHGLNGLKCEGSQNALANLNSVNMDQTFSKLCWLDFSKCSQLSEDSFITLFKKCPKLKTLSVSGCEGITDEVLSCLGSNSTFLRNLDLSFCSQISDAGVNYLAQGCPSIERLDLEECSNITNRALRSLARHCLQLQNLTLSRCDRITDSGIKDLMLMPGENTLPLKVLELDNCTQITDESVNTVTEYIERCKLSGMEALKRLHVFDCSRISQDRVRKFREAFPDVHVHSYFIPGNGILGNRHANRSRRNRNSRRRNCFCCCMM